MFAEIVLGKISGFITKENGYTVINKVYAQRLFTLLYPIV